MNYHKILLFLSMMALLLLPSVSFSQDLGSTDHFKDDPITRYNMQFWRPAPNPGDYLTTFGSMIDEEDWRVTGGFYLHYAHVPFKTKRPVTNADTSVLYNQTYLDLYASVSIFGWAEVALSMPFALYEATDFKGTEYPALSKLNGASGVGDLRVVVKGKILDLNEYPVGLALIADLSAPTGSKEKYMSDEDVTFAIQAALEFNPWGRARASANIGYRYRPRRYFFDRYEMGQAILLAGAITIPFFNENLDLLVDMRGEINFLQKDDNLSSKERPFEADLAFRYRLLQGEGWYRGLALTAGIGTGILGVGSPDVRVMFGVNFHWVNGGRLSYNSDTGGYITAVDPCPDPELTPPSQIPERCRDVSIDSDGDTIPDAQDKCPFLGRVGQIDDNGCPPDRDGDGIADYEDLCPDTPGLLQYQGCPPKDTDGDGIVDHLDKCPTEPETYNGFEDEDGCPDSDPNALVSLTKGKIEIKEQVFFETSKAKIKKESFELLDQVAALLNDNPHIGNIRVEGHTDSRGKYKLNMKLSQDRAASVRQYLIDKNVDPARLTAEGFGPDKPIDTNDTAEGRARNRRVEFVIVGLPEDAQTPNSGT